MLHIYASINEEARRRIGKTTKAALAQAKLRGVKLGTQNPVIFEAAKAGAIAKGTKTFERVLPQLERAWNEGASTLKDYASALNSYGCKTSTNKAWTFGNIAPYLKRARAEGWAL